MMLYALLVPVLIFFLGAGLDMGWYYLNVSRLQNAADAAAVAGAYELISSDDKIFSTYNAVKLVAQFPADDGNKYSLTDDRLEFLTSGNAAAAEYARKNLSTDAKAELQGDDYKMTSSYSRGGDSTVTMTPALYEDDDGNLYYVVRLAEQIHHFFIGFLDDMSAPVVSVAMLMKSSLDDDSSGGSTSDAKRGGGTSDADTSPALSITFDANSGEFSGGETESTKNLNSLTKIKANDEHVTISADDGEPTRNGYEFNGWNTKQDGTGTAYYEGKILVATEVEALFGSASTVTLYAQWKSKTDPQEEIADPMNNKTLWEQMEYVRAKNAYDGDWSVSTQKYTTTPNYIQFSRATEKSLDINTTTANSPTKKIQDIDQLFLDFLPESTSYTELRNPSTRPHAMINVNAAYDVRSGKNDDPLYIRIESEPAYNASGGNQGNPPQQIIININVSNLDDDKRPLIFYYDGPLEDREPVPVILNLNADFKGVLYMPDVPVVINGNGAGVGESGTAHVFEGFIIAKEFRALDKSSATYKTSHSVTIGSGRSAKTYKTTYKVDSTSRKNVQTISVTGDYQTLADKLDEFYLSSKSKFRKFNIETDLDFMYIQYDENGNMVPLTNREGTALIPLYDKRGNRITDWSKVTLYDKPADDSSRTAYPKKDTSHARVPLLDSDGMPVPLYDEAGNKIYFCEDYGRLGKAYNILTLHRVADNTRQPHEFLLTQPESNSDDWL